MKKLLIVLLFLNTRVEAQESAQARVIGHARYFLGSASKQSGTFLTGWSITNVMSDIPDNSNVFLGIGYAGKKWSIENMIQKQWNGAGNAFLLDWRFTAKPSPRINLYLEGAPRLDKKTFYEFVTIDVRVKGPFNVGFETENIHRVGKDTLGFGPRVSAPLPFKILGAKPSLVVSHQFRTLGPNVTRVYTILNWIF